MIKKKVALAFNNYISTWHGVITIYLATLLVFGLYLIYVQPLKDFLSPNIYLDLREDGYDLPEALAFYARLDVLGRAFYMRSTIFDTIWPLMLAFAGFLMARQTFQRRWLIIVFAVGPVSFGILDLFENIGLIAMNWNFPNITDQMVSYTNAITLTKLSTIPIAFGSFFIVPVIAIIMNKFWLNSRE